MADSLLPVFYTYKELVRLYKKGKITYKQLMLYKHTENYPVKCYEAMPTSNSFTVRFDLPENRFETATV